MPEKIKLRYPEASCPRVLVIEAINGRPVHGLPHVLLGARDVLEISVPVATGGSTLLPLEVMWSER
jgi:hypothetical protein